MNKNNISITSSSSSNMSGNSAALSDHGRAKMGLHNYSRNNVQLEQIKTVGTWTRKQVLGSGNFGRITLWVNTKDSDSEMIAIKECKPFTSQNREYHMKQWRQEIEIMKRLECENVVKGYVLPDDFLRLQVEMPLLAMEYCNNGDLRSILNKPNNCCGLEERDVRQVLSQISNAIQYLHQNAIVHRDIKPENILSHIHTKTRKTYYKLTDLGYAKQLIGSTKANTFVGTWEYLAPELFQNLPQNSNVDNWSFGLLAFEIIVGRRPFFYDRTMDRVINELKKKHSEHICLDIDTDTDQVTYLQVIPPNTLICDALKAYIENWLKIVLEYDPDKRGGNEAFQKIIDIVNLPMIRIFKIDSYKTISLVISRKTTLEDVQNEIKNKFSIPVKNQCIILPNGKLPEKEFGSQLIDTWLSNSALTEHYNPLEIAVVDYLQDKLHGGLHVNIEVPPLVTEILCNSFKSTGVYEVMKKAWKEAIWIARDLIKKHSSLQYSFKSCVLTAISRYNHAQNDNRLLSSLSNEALTTAHLMKQMTLSRLESLADQDDSETLSSETLICKKNLELINASLKICKIDVQKYYERCSKIVPKFSKELFLYDSLFREDLDSILFKRYQELLKGHEKYRNNRTTDPSATESIFNRVTAMFMHSETIFEPLLENIRVCLKFMRDIDIIREECQILSQRVSDIKTQVFQQHIDSFVCSPNPKTPRRRSMLLDSNVSNVKIVRETIYNKLESFKSQQFSLDLNDPLLDSLELCDMFY